ncbi:MAG: hypothetical protein KME35_23780 [Aphanocapsa sp. GSE-SYN-MK-11-07L]|jgi:hypothetical protein|nr:hypothetical protein [Aphanocapsa sp. GSE-SYN-MK-11-07L]
MKPEVRSINRPVQLSERPVSKRRIGKAPELGLVASLDHQTHQHPGTDGFHQLDDQFYLSNNGKKQPYPARYVGSLVVIWRSDLEQFHLLTCPEGEPLPSNRFATFEHCFSAAVELEQTFAMEDAIVLRSSETWEAIAHLIHQHWLREQVEALLGAE